MAASRPTLQKLLELARKPTLTNQTEREAITIIDVTDESFQDDICRQGIATLWKKPAQDTYELFGRLRYFPHLKEIQGLEPYLSASVKHDFIQRVMELYGQAIKSAPTINKLQEELKRFQEKSIQKSPNSEEKALGALPEDEANKKPGDEFLKQLKAKKDEIQELLNLRNDRFVAPRNSFFSELEASEGEGYSGYVPQLHQLREEVTLFRAQLESDLQQMTQLLTAAIAAQDVSKLDEFIAKLKHETQLFDAQDVHIKRAKPAQKAKAEELAATHAVAVLSSGNNQELPKITSQSDKQSAAPDYFFQSSSGSVFFRSVTPAPVIVRPENDASAVVSHSNPSLRRKNSVEEE